MKHNTWNMNKNLDDFYVVADMLEKECHQSKADVLRYLIKRCKKAEDINTAHAIEECINGDM